MNPVAAAPVDTAATAADTTARRPLPPIERSPVVPGITFPTGRPRQFGAPSLASTAESAPIPIRPAPGVPTFGAPPPDSTRAGARAAADTLGTRRAPPDFRPRGSRFQ